MGEAYEVRLQRTTDDTPKPHALRGAAMKQAFGQKAPSPSAIHFKAGHLLKGPLVCF